MESILMIFGECSILPEKRSAIPSIPIRKFFKWICLDKKEV